MKQSYSNLVRAKAGKTPPNKTSETKLKSVRDHIESFDVVEAHYIRANSTAKYLSPQLNITAMYDLYTTNFCAIHSIEPVKFNVYHKVFTEEYNIRFFIPKKDQCATCNAYDSASVEEKAIKQQGYTAHKKREMEAFEMKNSDKIAAASDPTFRSITFDLEAVLPTPFAGDSQIYYKRKLAVYNFTIHEGHSLDGFCYLWDETEGGRGAAEIASCLMHYLKNLPSHVSHVSAFCDTCAAQNRNQYLAASLLQTVQTTDSLYVIDIKYMESGHSHMEVDSMHSAIEGARRHQKIYTPGEWEVVVRSARKRPGPYSVHRMNHTDFFDVKQLSSEVVKNRSNSSSGESVNWLAIKWLRFEKSRPFTIQFKYSLMDAEFREIIVLPEQHRPVEMSQFQPLYNTRLLISSAKKKDLLQLLKSGVIPKEYAHYYNELPSSNTVRDCLAEPSADEIVDDDQQDLLDEQNSEIEPDISHPARLLLDAANNVAVEPLAATFQNCRVTDAEPSSRAVVNRGLQRTGAEHLSDTTKKRRDKSTGAEQALSHRVAQ